MLRSSVFRAVAHCFRTLSLIVFDLVRLAFFVARSHSTLAAENLFLRKQLALFQERKAKPRRADDSTRWMMATLSRMFPWREALVNVKPDTLIRWHRKGFRLFWRWHRKGFRLFWRWKSKPRGRPRLAKDLRQLIREMAAENPTWGQERIANELRLKLGIRLSPRTVEKYLRDGPARTPDPKQRWLTFVHDHAKVIVACDFFVVITATFRTLYAFVIMELGTRRILHDNVTAHPTAEWTFAAVPGGAPGRPSVSVRYPRPGQHLFEAVGQCRNGPRRESSSNSRAGTHGKLHMRTVRRDTPSRVFGLPNSTQRTPPENDD